MADILLDLERSLYKLRLKAIYDWEYSSESDEITGIRKLSRDSIWDIPDNNPSVTQATFTSPASILESGELQRLVDAIDEAGLSLDQYSHRELMIRISTNTGIIPTRLRLHDIAYSPHPEKMTAGTNLFRGISDGNVVALKKPRHHSCADGSGAVPADLYREYYTLSMLDHSHILPVLGIFADPHDSLPAMVSPYMFNGTISAYLESNPDADRLRLLAGVASGLDYLHNLPNPVVHCDVRSANTMVDAEGNAVVIDFGSSLVLESGVAYTPSDNGLSGNPRWMPPEALRTGSYPITPKVDVWSVASLGIEVFSGKRPFDDIIRDGAVVIEIAVKSRRPSRPRGVVLARQLNDAVWALMEQSWKLDPSHRPSMRDIYLLLSSFSEPISSV